MRRSVFLKIKLKSLAAEARIIRAEERKWKGLDRCRLHNHRLQVVRRAARNSHLAYAYIRGRRYREVEPTNKSSPNWKEVERMVVRYGDDSFDTNWSKEGEIQERMRETA